MARDPLSRAQRSEQMRRVKNRDTKPELLVRKLLFAAGYRYRLQARDLPGSPDLVFRSRKKAIFIHGCFWHRHPGCKLARMPKSRIDFWEPKLLANRQRDIQKQEELKRLGWSFEIVWECELSDQKSVIERLKKFLGETNTYTLREE